MHSKRTMSKILLPLLGILVLILDGKTAVTGAADAIEICLQTVIPSLFPFFLLSILLTGSLTGIRIHLLSPFRKMCAIPKGAESLFVIGLLGGYPTGAQAVAEAYEKRQISKQAAQRMLGFCSNAGPAFIFGICSRLFASATAVWLLWAIHLVSAVAVGIILPRSPEEECLIQEKTVALPYAFRKSIYIMASVCGWIILFRVLITFLNRWFLWLLPQQGGILLTGIIELTNGICLLSDCESEGLRFIISASTLGFGGICVGMQTVSVTVKTGTGWYFPGKLFQGTFSLFLSLITANFLYGPIAYGKFAVMITGIICCILFLILRYYKITVDFLRNRMYNNQKSAREFQPCCFERK